VVLQRLESDHERLVLIPTRRHDVAVETGITFAQFSDPATQLGPFALGRNRPETRPMNRGHAFLFSTLGHSRSRLEATQDVTRRALGRHVIHDDVEVEAPMRRAPSTWAL